MATLRITKMKGPDLPRSSSPAPARLHEWGSMIWVKVTHPQGQWAQDVRDEVGTVLRQERACGVTDPQTGRQVAVPQLLTFTRELEKALNERPLGAREVVASIVECTAEEVEAFLGRSAADEARSTTALSEVLEQLQTVHALLKKTIASRTQSDFLVLKHARQAIDIVANVRDVVQAMVDGAPVATLPAPPPIDYPSAGREGHLTRATQGREGRFVHGD